MKKNAKRLLGLLIVLAMMVSLVGTMALADSTAAADKPVVTYIGTSVSSGFYLPQYENEWAPASWETIKKEWRTIDEDSKEIRLAYRPYDLLAPRSAPRLVAEGLGMIEKEDITNRCDRFHKMCFTGLRTSELLRFLYGKGSAWDQKMEKDWISQEYMGGVYSDFKEEDVAWLYDNAQQWVTDSDIIIVEIGANDVMTTLAYLGLPILTVIAEFSLIGLGLLVLLHWILHPNRELLDFKNMENFPQKLEMNLKEQWERH